MSDTLQKGQRVRVKLPYSREHLSYGTVTNYDSELNWYGVQLERNEPPFKGYYASEVLEKICRIEIDISDKLMAMIDIVAARRYINQAAAIIFLLTEAIDDIPGDLQ